MQDSLRIDSQHDMYIAGRVVFVYLQGGKYEAAVKDGTLRNLRRVEIVLNCFSDHLCSGYIAGTSQVASRPLGGIDRSFAPWEVVQEVAKPTRAARVAPELTYPSDS